MSNNTDKIRIEAENYQEYYDTTAGNRGKAYRQDDVDIWKNSSKKDNFRVAAIKSGEWLTYDLDVPLDGTYQIAARVGTRAKNNRKIAVSLDGEKATEFSFKQNSNGKFWQTIISDEIELNTGSQQLRLDMLSSSFAIDYLELIPVSTYQDSTAPIASLAAPDFEVNNINSSYSFEVKYSDNQAIDIAGIDSQDVRVVGPDGFSQLASLVSVNSDQNQPLVIAEYAISAPKNGWSGANIGEYTVSIEPNQVSDVQGNFVADITVGDFAIDVVDSKPNSDQPKAVKIGGGGFVTGIVIHPLAADVMYARTDVGGLYRWDASNQEWYQSLSIDSVGEKISLSVESVAVDPNNPKVVYAATGAYTHNDKGGEIPGHVLKSTDGGNTWQVLDLSVAMGGNGEWRWAGERLAVDPNNSDIVYFGSRLDGLWRSEDGGMSWNQIDTSTIPVGKSWGKTKDVAGVTFVEFDQSATTNGRSKTIYVGVAGSGVYQTTDGGKSWQLISAKWSESSVPQQGEVNAEGELVVTLYDPKNGSNGGVWKFDGSWEDVTPKNGKNYAGLTVAPNNPNTLYTVTYPMTPEDIYRSTDGGETWTALNNQQQGLDWYPSWNFWTLSGDLAVNPDDSEEVWLSNGMGIWHTEQADANTVNWKVQVNGIEETVAFDAVSTPGGANLITAIADFDGFRHTDLNAVPTHNHSDGEFSTTTSIAYSSGNPNFLVRTTANHHEWVQHSGFSIDNGASWQKFASIENGTHPNDLSFGNIAVSATDTNNIVWQGSNWIAPYYTEDGGATWNKITYFDEQFGGGAHTHLWNHQQILAADSVRGGTFYIYHHVGGQLVRTQNGGETWTVANQDSLLPEGVWTGANVKTLPGVGEEVWVSLDDQGLYRSSNGGESFTQITSVEDADAFGFGKAAPGREHPTLFVSGQIEDQMGVFGSTDLGNSWTQVDDLPDQFLGEVTSVTGDMNSFGRVYVGTANNAFVYGDL